MISMLPLGAPGLYGTPDAYRRTLGTVRMDVCAFLGVAPRGPCREPVLAGEDATPAAIARALGNRRRSVAVPIGSWEQYVTTFGAYEGPGRLPYAVASFFENGGAQAYVVRIVHDYDNEKDGEGVAKSTLKDVTSTGALPVLAARSEGEWGNKLRARFGHTLRLIDFDRSESSVNGLALPDLEGIEPGSLLRLQYEDADDPSADYDVLRFVRWIERRGAAGAPVSLWDASFGTPPLAETPIRAELVEGYLEISDEGTGLSERHAGLAFSSAHSRWMATVLFRDSRLVLPTADWLDVEIEPESIRPASSHLTFLEQPERFSGGQDRYDKIDHDDFFDADWTFGQEEPGSGVHALVGIADVSLVVAADLYVPEPLAERLEFEPDAVLSNAEFAPCVKAATEIGEVSLPEPTLPGLLLDPATDLEAITTLQARLVALADRLREFVVLLDVPPGLTERQILRWRSLLASPYAAAYHPWLRTNIADDARDALTLLNPSAAAAGIIARQERQFGVPHGPANVVARAVWAAEAAVTRPQHDRLHPLGINVFRQERDGVWLTAGRTLSRDASLRQLSVVRLMVMLRRALERQMQWTVFEPNGPSLWADLRHQLRIFLRQLYQTGAFRGATEDEAFFVRCDATLNPPRQTDLGRLVAEIGVAPAEPLEFIVIRFAREADGTLSVEA